MPQKVASHLGLFCLLRGILGKNYKIKFLITPEVIKKKVDSSKFGRFKGRLLMTNTVIERLLSIPVNKQNR